MPAYLLDREGMSHAKVLSNSIKQKRKEKAGKWNVPIPKVRPVAEDEVFKVMRSGKRQKKQWKRQVNKVCFVGDSFTRKPPKFERYVRPAALRFKKAHVTHPELKATFQLDLIGIKKNPQSPLYTSLGVITKGTVIEVNCSDLGLVTPSGKVVWGKYAQVTNNPRMTAASTPCSSSERVRPRAAAAAQRAWRHRSIFAPCLLVSPGATRAGVGRARLAGCARAQLAGCARAQLASLASSTEVLRVF